MPALSGETFAQVADRYRRLLTQQVDLPADVLAQAGTTVVGREDRAGSRAAAVYWAGHHAIVWADPAVTERLDHLASSEAALTPEAAAEVLPAAGFKLVASADMHTLAAEPPTVPSPSGPYLQRTLLNDNPEDVALVGRFLTRCAPDDVEEAGLEEFDEKYEELAITVLLDDDPASPEHGEIAAYSSALPWDWDPDFLDIGVLVHPDHRRRGLARAVVAATVAAIRSDGLTPLYRHEVDNSGSAAVAHSLGFRPATTMSYYRSPEAADR